MAIGELVVPLQKVELDIGLTIGIGLTVKVKFSDAPGQVTLLKVYCGVTPTVPVTIAFPPLITEKAAIFPCPKFANPMEGVLFTHVYEVPVPVKITGVVSVL